MTNLNAVNIGFNKYCGPAVLSILTGKSTDHCAQVISSINGQYKIEGVQLKELLIAAGRLGFDNEPINPSTSLFGTLTRLVNTDGIYIVTVPHHFVVIEVNDKKIYFCDNHTKEPMPAASSARLTQRVLAVNRMMKRREPMEIGSKLVAHKVYGDGITVMVDQEITYDMPQYNKKVAIARLRFNTQENFDEFIASLTKE